MLLVFEDLLPHKISGSYISTRVVVTMSLHVRSSHAHLVCITDDRKLIHTMGNWYYLHTTISGNLSISSKVTGGGQTHGHDTIFSLQN